MKVQGNKRQSDVSRMDGKKRIRGVKFWTSRLIFNWLLQRNCFLVNIHQYYV